MNQEHICDFSLPLSLEIAAMRAGSLPPPPAWIPATVFPLLWPFMDLSLIRLAQTKSGWLSKQAGSKSNLYCFVIGVTTDRQTLDRNHIRGGGGIVYFSSRIRSFQSVVLGSLIKGWGGRAGDHGSETGRMWQKKAGCSPTSQRRETESSQGRDTLRTCPQCCSASHYVPPTNASRASYLVVTLPGYQDPNVQALWT